MVTARRFVVLVLGALGCAAMPSFAQDAGSIRGMVFDSDFNVPLPAARVTVLESGQTVTGTDAGNFIIPDVPPGTYTLVCGKDGYGRQVVPNIVVTAGQLTEIDISLAGEFSEMEEFIVREFLLSGGSEAALLNLREFSSATIDAIGADLMSRAGASDAAGALNFVAGASVQDGKFAVIRGLPDRFVSSQINGVRLPTADEDKRAVQLDQFPSAVIESIQISKTFTPDQQGDASGGAVNILLKGIPDRNFIEFKSQFSYNKQVAERSDFLTYTGGGLSLFGDDRGGRDIPDVLMGEVFDGAAGVSRGESPNDYKGSFAAGGTHVFDTGVKIGGFASFFYERDSSFYDNGIDDSYWVTSPGTAPVPQTTQGVPSDGDFKTKLFDIEEGSQTVQWGALITGGIESENHSLNFSYLFTHTAEDTATLAEDTRGKEYFFPGHDPNDPTAIGNSPDNRDAAPYIRTETLNYTERTTETTILRGTHVLPIDDMFIGDAFTLRAPEVDWTISKSTAKLYQPDKRQFGGLWYGESFNPGFPPFLPSFTSPAEWRPFKPAANFTLGNFQRIWKEIEEESDQFQVNLKVPFEQWGGDEGFMKFGVFSDDVKRSFNQDTFSNFNDNTASFQGGFEDFWTAVFPFETHPISDGPPFVDVDYEGSQEIFATYGMIDLPLSSKLNLIAGARFETTEIGVVNDPESDATWFPSGATTPVSLNPGDADVDFKQNDVLPSIGFIFRPDDKLTFRASYSETIARQTFKELTPIQQQEFLGGDVFIGNPELQMAALKNYDFRIDYRPNEGGLLSASIFKKDVRNAIENVQRVSGFTYTTPVNYPTGELFGYELEARQDLGSFWEPLTGLALGANATFIDSVVTLPEDEAAGFLSPNILAPITERDMTNAPEHLYNLYVTYDSEDTGTQASLFYSVRGDTLLAGAGQSNGNFVPSVYSESFGTLNFSVSQKIGKYLTLTFQAKNLTNPSFTEVYRSEYIGPDVLKTSYSKGVDYAIGLRAEFQF